MYANMREREREGERESVCERERERECAEPKSVNLARETSPSVAINIHYYEMKLSPNSSNIKYEMKAKLAFP